MIAKALCRRLEEGSVAMSVLLAMTGQAEVDVDIESIDVDLVDCEGG